MTEVLDTEDRTYYTVGVSAYGSWSRGKVSRAGRGRREEGERGGGEGRDGGHWGCGGSIVHLDFGQSPQSSLLSPFCGRQFAILCH